LQNPWCVFFIQRPAVFDPDEAPEAVIGLVPGECQGPKPTDDKPKENNFTKEIWSYLSPLNATREANRG
jgi:hypothetical protein